LARHGLLVTKEKAYRHHPQFPQFSPHCVSPALRISCILPTTSVLHPNTLVNSSRRHLSRPA
jgi:hypothetical protein